MMECYSNALRAIQTRPDLHDAWYVEGVVVSAWPIPSALEHAWVETRDGAILDPTLALRDPAFPARPRWPLSYDSVVRYTGAQAWERARATGNARRWEDDEQSRLAMVERREALNAQLFALMAKRARRTT
jgi:hypothetical protein